MDHQKSGNTIGSEILLPRGQIMADQFPLKLKLPLYINNVMPNNRNYHVPGTLQKTPFLTQPSPWKVDIFF